MREIDRTELRAPAVVLDVDINQPRGRELVDVAGYATAWCLIRQGGVPSAVRFFDVANDECIRSDDVFSQLVATELPAVEAAGPESFAPLTVVICTRDRPESLRRTLESLAVQSDDGFDVLVVDNSTDGNAERAVGSVDGLALRFTHEPLPGLARARNRGLAEVSSELVAWIDDDEMADPDWIAWIKRGFASPDHPDAVVGVMLPAELETNAQVDWERYGGFNKGRGMEPVNLQAGTDTVFDPLYPRPIFGSGGNMAFRTKVLRTLGGFETRLGTGTLTRGGEDTLMLSLVLESGSIILYWPPAVTWHYHRRTDEALEKQLFGNSAGLTAFYASVIISSPKYALRLFGFMRRFLVEHVREPDRGGQGELPRNLARASRKGLLQGPWLYVRELRRQRRPGTTPR